MTQTAVATAEAPEPKAPKNTFAIKPPVVMAAGGLALAAWLGFLAGGLLAVDEETTRLLSDVQLVAAVLAAAAALWAGRRTPAIVSSVAALAYAGVWFGLGKIHWSVSDVIYLALIAVFYLSVPIGGVSTLLAGRSVLKSLR